MDRSTVRAAARIDAPPTSVRPVRSERWARRVFHAHPCAFLLDVPLDMTGMIAGAMRATTAAGHRALEGGDVLLTDSIHRGAILVEIDGATASGGDVLRIESVELLVREVPSKPGRLRAELDELVRWSRELGHEVAAIYVRYDRTDRVARPLSMFVALRGDTDVEGTRVEQTG